MQDIVHNDQNQSQGSIVSDTSREQFGASGLPMVPTPVPPPIEGRLSSQAVRVPVEATRCTGITVHGHHIKTLAFSTDVAVVHNTNADAIMAVYPFTGHPMITQAIMSVAKAPVFVGVGGGTTTGQRVLELAMFAEMQGVVGVVLNAPSPAETVERVAATVDVPVVATIVEWNDESREKVRVGARIVNVAAGKNTPVVVAQIREEYPDFPVIATGGQSSESICATIAAGANAISWTPPSSQMLQGSMMERYRAAGSVKATSDDAQRDAADAAPESVARPTGRLSDLLT